jgi:sn-glycerol 3-phosphate transport system ATP-binding protein
VRPEHLDVAQEGNGLADLRVDVVEQLGADTLVHRHFGGDRTDLTVRLPGARPVKSGELLPLSVDPQHMHLFDIDGGTRLGTS